MRATCATSKRIPTSGSACIASGAPLARILDDDDPQARLDAFHRRAHETAVRKFGTDLLTIQFELGSASAAE